MYVEFCRYLSWTVYNAYLASRRKVSWYVLTRQNSESLGILCVAAVSKLLLLSPKHQDTWKSTAKLFVRIVRTTCLLDRADVPTNTQSIKGGGPTEDGLLWYFAFGANMDPDVLSKRRNVYPKESQPCKVVGYVLTFSHIGLPYMEPGFGTIEPLQWQPPPPTLILGSDIQQKAPQAQAGKATMYSTPSKPVAEQLAVATKKQQLADAAADQDPPSPRPSTPTNGVFSSPELPVSFVPARSASKRSRTSPVSDASCDYESNDFDLDGSHSTGDQASTSRPALENGHKHVTVHGVVHQITQQDMAQIVKTEGGGGGGDHGYYLEEVKCEMYSGETVQAVALLTYPNSRHRQVIMP